MEATTGVENLAAYRGSRQGQRKPNAVATPLICGFGFGDQGIEVGLVGGDPIPCHSLYLLG